MTMSTFHEAVSPVPVTAVIVDIRNFTPHLIGTSDDDHGINKFCHFISNFYALCLKSSLMALRPERRDDPALFMSSTGDGVVAIFFGDEHYRHAYLAAIVLNRVLGNYCSQYNSRLEGGSGLPLTSFGIGVESGAACRIRAVPKNSRSYPIIDTFIGNCINVAARIESLTKSFHQANTLISAATHELLCHKYFHESCDLLVQEAANETLSDAEKLAIFSKMDAWNRELCMTYVHHHVLKGVDKPLPVFRLSDRSTKLENPRFIQLLNRLVEGSAAHEAEIIRLLREAGDLSTTVSNCT